MASARGFLYFSTNICGGGTADDGEEVCGGTAGDGEGDTTGKAKTCSCGSIRNAFEQVPDSFEQVRPAQLAPVPPTWGAHETQSIQTPGDLSGAGPHDGRQVVNPLLRLGAHRCRRGTVRGGRHPPCQTLYVPPSKS